MAPSPPAWGHALKAECSLKNGKIRVEAFFSDDSPAVNAKVEVRDSAEKTILASGTTDAQGNWTFPAPAAGDYLVIVDAGMGHRAREPITVPETAGLQTSSEQPPAGGLIVSGNPHRDEFTRFPFAKVGLGVGAIFLVSFAFVVARRLAKAKPLTSQSQRAE
jgi:hypothetical protein